MLSEKIQLKKEKLVKVEVKQEVEVEVTRQRKQQKRRNEVAVVVTVVKAVVAVVALVVEVEVRTANKKTKNQNRPVKKREKSEAKVVAVARIDRKNAKTAQVVVAAVVEVAAPKKRKKKPNKNETKNIKKEDENHRNSQDQSVNRSEKPLISFQQATDKPPKKPLDPKILEEKAAKEEKRNFVREKLKKKDPSSKALRGGKTENPESTALQTNLKARLKGIASQDNELTGKKTIYEKSEIGMESVSVSGAKSNQQIRKEIEEAARRSTLIKAVEDESLQSLNIVQYSKSDQLHEIHEQKQNQNHFDAIYNPKSLQQQQSMKKQQEKDNKKKLFSLNKSDYPNDDDDNDEETNVKERKIRHLRGVGSDDENEAGNDSDYDEKTQTSNYGDLRGDILQTVTKVEEDQNENPAPSLNWRQRAALFNSAK